MNDRCVLCEADLTPARVVGTIDRHGEEIRRVECPGCTLVQASPRPSAAEVAELYAGDYWRTHPRGSLILRGPEGVRCVSPSDTEAYDEGLDAMASGRAAALVDALRLPRGAKVLEVGCGDGRTLAAMLRAGWDARGIEPDLSQVEAARERARPHLGVATSTDPLVLHGDIASPTDRAVGLWGHFDAVVSFHVVEHLADPLAGLCWMRRMLKPGGLLWCEVPDLENAREPLEKHWWQKVHLCDFTAATLEDLGHRTALGGNVSVRRTFAGLQMLIETAQDLRDVADADPYLPAIMASRIAATVEVSVLDRLLSGELDTLTPEQAAGVRREMKAWVESVGRLHDGYRGAAGAIEALARQLEGQAERRMGAWHEDDWHYGFVIGEGFALGRAAKLLGLLGSAMGMLEHRDAERATEGS